MLLSPGRSPRYISSPSPSTASDSFQTPVNSSSLQIYGKTKSLVNAKNHKRQDTVLDEDTYVAAIEKIIERDFFPDIPKLRDRSDWLEAIRSRDPIQIRDAQLKIIERRGLKATSCDTDTESNRIRTPGSALFKSPTPINKTPTVRNTGEIFSVGCDTDDSIDSSMKLDEFFRRYTSEDNRSFSKILEKVNRKRKDRYGFLTEGEKNGVEGIEDVKRDRITDGFGTSDQPPSTLDGWKYTAKNLLMYHPADLGEAPLTEEERAVRVKGLTKEISGQNTRFHSAVLNSIPKAEDAIADLYPTMAGVTPVPFSGRDEDKSKKYDLEDLRKTPNQFYVESTKKSDNGYSYVKTPSPAPGVDGSPFVTWGEIEGTPLRLEAEETPIGIGGSGKGAHFSIAHPPSRDLKAHSLSREAARNLRARSKMFEKPPLPSPIRRGGSVSPGLQKTLSTAAQKFVRIAMAKSSSVDETLRASYRGRSPSSCTPNAVRSVSRLGRDVNLGSTSPSVKGTSSPTW